MPSPGSRNDHTEQLGSQTMGVEGKWQRRRVAPELSPPHSHGVWGRQWADAFQEACGGLVLAWARCPSMLCLGEDTENESRSRRPGKEKRPLPLERLAWATDQWDPGAGSFVTAQAVSRQP